MKNLVIGVVLGLVVGLVIGYAVTVMQNQALQVCTATSPDIDKTVETAVEKMNTLIHANYPEVNVRVTQTQPYGELYLLTLEYYNESGTLATQTIFMTGNGSMLLLNDPRCIVDLSKQPEQPAQPGKINVSADDDPWRGNKDAKVVIIEFSDYACPYCARFATEVEPKILDNYGDRVKIVFRDFPVHGQIAYLAAEAADCAGEQGKYWEYHDLLFENQHEWMSNTTKLYGYAEQLGLNTTAFKACLDSGKYKSEVDKDLQDGRNYGVTGTPTFFINGKMVVGYRPYEEFTSLIEQELQ